MSAHFVSSATLPIVDGVDTVGYTVFNQDAEEVASRSTESVVRIFEGSDYSIYQVQITVPSGVTAGTVVWDDDDGNAVNKSFFIGTANVGAVPDGEFDSTVDSEWGGSSADSYISLAEAEDLVEANVIDTFDWDDASGVNKDASLRMATRQIDSFNYLGCRRDYSQSLKFPRNFYYVCPLDVTEAQMLSDVQVATAIQAAYLLRSGGRDEHAERIAAGIRQSSESVGPIRDQFTYSGAMPIPICADSLRLLAKYRDSKRIYRA